MHIHTYLHMSFEETCPCLILAPLRMKTAFSMHHCIHRACVCTCRDKQLLYVFWGESAETTCVYTARESDSCHISNATNKLEA